MKNFIVDRLGYRPGNIIDLRDATNAEFRATFGDKENYKGQLFNWVRAGKSDVVVFYSGHGVPGLKDPRGYLLPSDGKPNLAELTAYSHGTLRHWSFFQPDLIENIWASARAGDALYTWKHLDDSWTFEAERLGVESETDPLDPSDAEHQSAARDLWRYRAEMIEAFHARHPEQARSKEEELGRLRPDEAEALRQLGYIE